MKLSEVDAWVRATRQRGAESDARQRPSATELDGPGTVRQPADFVLIVDDDESLRDSLHDVVSDQGCGALFAADGIEAVRLLRSEDQPKPCLILLDLHMPSMDGVAFPEEQRRDPPLAAIPVIIITAERRSDIGGIATLRKPLDIARPVAAIRGEIG